MILLDNIIFKLQNNGGVTNVWKAILKEVKHSSLKFGFIGTPNFEVEEADNILLFKDYKLPVFLRRYLDFFNSEARVFHSSYFRINKSKKVKNVVTIHDFTYEKYNNGLRKKIHCIQKKHALKNASAIICVSENTKKDLIEYHPYLDHNIINVIYNGYDKDVFFPLKNNINIKENYLLSVGGRNIHKNFFFTLDLMKSEIIKRHSIKLLVVGGGEISKQEKEYIDKFNLSERIVFKTGVSDLELNKLYNNALALVYPSYYEGFGIPPLEAMAAGCPVISSSTSSLPEVLGDCGLYIDVNNYKTALAHIDTILDDEKRKNIIIKGFRQASKFSWDKTAKETIEIYKKLLKSI